MTTVNEMFSNVHALNLLVEQYQGIVSECVKMMVQKPDDRAYWELLHARTLDSITTIEQKRDALKALAHKVEMAVLTAQADACEQRTKDLSTRYKRTYGEIQVVWNVALGTCRVDLHNLAMNEQGELDYTISPRDGERRYTTIHRIEVIGPEYRLGGDHKTDIESASLAWPSYNRVSPDDAERFASLLNDAMSLAWHLNRQFQPWQDEYAAIRARIEQEMQEPEAIIHEANDPNSWICLCGNTPSEDGFHTCDRLGDEIEPVAGGDWDGVSYVCGRCGRIIDQDDWTVTGRKRQKHAL